jgi:hypothetical protein
MLSGRIVLARGSAVCALLLVLATAAASGSQGHAARNEKKREHRDVLEPIHDEGVANRDGVAGVQSKPVMTGEQATDGLLRFGEPLRHMGTHNEHQKVNALLLLFFKPWRSSHHHTLK